MGTCQPASRAPGLRSGAVSACDVASSSLVRTLPPRARTGGERSPPPRRAQRCTDSPVSQGHGHKRGRACPSALPGAEGKGRLAPGGGGGSVPRGESGGGGSGPRPMFWEGRKSSPQRPRIAYRSSGRPKHGRASGPRQGNTACATNLLRGHFSKDPPTSPTRGKNRPRGISVPFLDCGDKLEATTLGPSLAQAEGHRGSRALAGQAPTSAQLARAFSEIQVCGRDACVTVKWEEPQPRGRGQGWSVEVMFQESPVCLNDTCGGTRVTQSVKVQFLTSSRS